MQIMMDQSNFSLNSLDTLLPNEINYDSAQFEDLRDGYLFGEFKNYRLKKKLGEGGMGQTWLAEELVENEVSQRVVLKILTRELRGNADALKEVRRVFDLTKNLNHSSICPLLGRYVDPNFGDFLVMKYADGGTLADWFKAQPGHENGLPLETLLPIFRPLAEALDLAYRNGILHRDVKPQNIMFMGKTSVLIDFGIAARIRPENVTSNTQSFSRTDTMAHSSSGTPQYMAPEQMEGSRQNARTDQYALATVLYEMLTGSLPFSGSVVSIVLQKSRFQPQSPQFAPHVN
ncbi:MAG: serine/threonine protein kinase, partial [Planctomycetaceae bacterium]|nr:serine/threonine protein kinase [Planctomycetaceae bacterium]